MKKKLTTPIIKMALQTDFFSYDNTNLKILDILKNIKQFIIILKKNKNLPICFVIQENINVNAFYLINKYISKKKVALMSIRQALLFQDEVILIFLCNKNINNKIINKISENALAFSFTFNYKKTQVFSVYNILTNFENYKQFLFLITLINNI